jgi:hypothetical protein
MGKPPVVPESLDFTEDASLDEGVFPAVLRIYDICGVDPDPDPRIHSSD